MRVDEKQRFLNRHNVLRRFCMSEANLIRYLNNLDYCVKQLEQEDRFGEANPADSFRLNLIDALFTNNLDAIDDMKLLSFLNG